MAKKQKQQEEKSKPTIVKYVLCDPQENPHLHTFNRQEEVFEKLEEWFPKMEDASQEDLDEVELYTLDSNYVLTRMAFVAKRTISIVIEPFKK
jgi:hypothetical protein